MTPQELDDLERHWREKAAGYAEGLKTCHPSYQADFTEWEREATATANAIKELRTEIVKALKAADRIEKLEKALQYIARGEEDERWFEDLVGTARAALTASQERE